MLSAPNLFHQLQIVYQDDNIRVGLDKSLSFIYIEWLKHATSTEFRALFQKVADIAIENKVKFWLSDARLTHYLEFSDQNWLIQQILPLISQSSLEKFARVSTKEGFAMMDISRVYASIEKLYGLNSKPEFDFFFSIDAALAWLFSKK